MKDWRHWDDLIAFLIGCAAMVVTGFAITIAFMVAI